jgi:hypothetical protein
MALILVLETICFEPSTFQTGLAPIEMSILQGPAVPLKIFYDFPSFFSILWLTVVPVSSVLIKKLVSDFV